MDVVLQKLLEWGPGGLLAAFFGWMWLKEREERVALQDRLNSLQDRRVTEAREDVSKMAHALGESSDAIETNTSSIATLSRMVESSLTRGAGR